MTLAPKPFLRVHMACSPCGRGFHRECRKGCKNCHPKVELSIGSEGEDEIRQPKKLNLKDPKSTGRKRAAVLYPIDPNENCEWQGKRNCGGGRRPVIGCRAGKQQHRHHGPVKDTTRNEQGNVHRICTPCHIHWHELNDLEYDASENELLPHVPVACDEMTIVQNEVDWKSGEMGRRYQLASSLNKEKKHHEEED